MQLEDASQIGVDVAQRRLHVRDRDITPRRRGLGLHGRRRRILELDDLDLRPSAPVDERVAQDRDQPRPRIDRRGVAREKPQRPLERVLDQILALAVVATDEASRMPQRLDVLRERRVHPQVGDILACGFLVEQLGQGRVHVPTRRAAGDFFSEIDTAPSIHGRSKEQTAERAPAVRHQSWVMWKRAMGDESTVTVDHEMGAGRPPSDPLAMERARAKAESALFGRAEPPRLGRYIIDEPLASGGMGVVFGAHDPELDRNVALKVLHLERTRDIEEGQRRLALEARALAKLDHPNIVKVHDVLTIDHQVVIVMELVEGVTLDAWATQHERSWQEILEVYLQAGAGLAAAHAVGIVHRDFKPSNAIIGKNGRVRVLDFGLARLASQDASPASGAGVLDAHTMTGAVLGTFAYAAPEQLAGEVVTPAADQFSFCVALHRALEGVAPFAGTSVDELVANIAAGIVHENPRRRLPAWLRRVLHRGMAASPADRYTSLDDLLVELRRVRGWKRWRLPAAALALVTVSAIVAHAASGSEPPPCDGGQPELARVWTVDMRALLHDRFRSAHLDSIASQWVDAWSLTHRGTCKAQRRGAMSSVLADRSTTCLVRRLRDFGGALDVLAAEGERPKTANAIEVIAALPQPSPCGDAEWLQGSNLEPPPNAATTKAVDAIRDRLARSAASDRAGRATLALEDANLAIDEARAVAYQPVLAEALLAAGRLRLFRNELDAARPLLDEATKLALASDMTDVAVEATARQVFVDGGFSGDTTRLAQRLNYIEPLSSSKRTSRFARALLMNNIGTVYLAANQTTSARDYFERAERVLDGELPNVELVCIDQNLASLTTDHAKRERLLWRAWDRMRRAYGENHLSTLDARGLLAQFTSDAHESLTMLDHVCISYRDDHPDFPRLYASCLLETSFLAWLLDADDVQSRFEDALAVSVANASTSIIDRRHVITALLALHGGDPALALREVLPLTLNATSERPAWEHKVTAQATLVAALATTDLGQPAEDLFARSERAFQALSAQTPGTAYRLAAQRASSRQRRP